MKLGQKGPLTPLQRPGAAVAPVKRGEDTAFVRKRTLAYCTQCWASGSELVWQRAE